MRIENRSIDLNRTTGVDGSKPETASRQSVTKAEPASRSDRVQISDAGRALSAQVDGATGARKGLSPERTAEIRERILGGAYNSVEVVEEVARRMLERGDV